MLRDAIKVIALVGGHACGSFFAVVMIVSDLMSAGSHWVTTALSVALFLPMLALEYAGLELMERSLPLALLVNSAISVGVFLVIRRAVRASRGSASSAEPGAAADRGRMWAFWRS